ncbi:protein kinase [Pseudogemmatithrix spongiicola]|uniref:Protein kinase n=1 Tax=Pseudogemmatithrix spongiicola TaxID=3062599 RepID=A0AA49Q5T6_9BACT|nr:protein kinase [Gemmatimonadaceae bacterium 'strain 138']WKW16027.1 protein kinase [Gemmatimonadaceae bacterium 'strain 318']
MTHDALRSALDARLGEQYEIESLLGQGGMGSVFRAMDRTLHRPVAIKVISGDVALNPQLKERFLLEARTVAKLRHPNIVAVYSAGEADGLLYFVMELVPGESLRDLLTREGTVAPERGERILHELAMALDYAHANGIVHRDVKPENILLDRDTGRAMLTDFGVARALENSGNMTGTGMILGSPRYMSPEQATGESTIDGRSDLYALALVGYEMFTGKPVVDSGNVAGMLVKHLTETPKPLGEAVPKVPEGTAVAIDRALAKDRDQRWATGREMAEVIAASWTPTPGSGATRAIGAMKAKKAPPKAALGGAFVAIFMSLLTVFITSRDDGGDPRKSYAVVPFDIQSGNADVQWLRDGAVNMLTLALSQWTDLQVMDYERTLKYVADAGVEDRRVDLERAQEIARRGGAGTLVMGSVSTTSDSLLVTARLYDVKSGKAINTATRAAALAADPRSLFDDLARYLLDVAGGSASASVDVARQTTTSLTAYRAYLDGVRYLNSWRLAQADSALQVAIAADSTFALAHHKRALALGWGDGSGPAYLDAARRAVELSDRLPPRQQALVRGHLALAEGLSGQLGASGAADLRARLREAQRIYEELVARDSLVAEGWYGLADAYFHDQLAPGDSLPEYSRRLNRSIYGFRRAIEIDSTFHLAYSHLVQQYQGLSSPQTQGILDGDSVIILQSREQLEAMGGLAEFERRRMRARDIGLEMARGWVRADPDAPTSHFALANGYFGAGLVDSALAVIDRALRRPGLDAPGMRMQRVSFRLLADQPVEAYAELQEILASTTPATFRRIPANERITAAAMALNTSAAVGNAAAIERIVAFVESVDPVFPFTQSPTREIFTWYTAGLRVGMTGSVTGADRRLLAAGARRVASGSEGLMAQLAATSGGVTFMAYLATRDTLFSNTIRRMPGGANIQHTDLDALEALTRGDTATARDLASRYTPPDSLKTARFGFAGLRAYARAEVLAAVGNTDWAIRYLENIAPPRFNAMGLAEPGFAVYTRSFLTRGTLYERANQPDKAIGAYEEYLRRTADGDAIVEPLRREARASLTRLRDSRR